VFTLDPADTTVCTIDGTNTLTMIGTGSCKFTASADADGTYTAATPVTKSITISQRSQTIAWTNPPTTLSVSGGPITLTGLNGASASSGLPITYSTASMATVCTVTAGGTITPVGAGSCVVKASQGGNAQYKAATAVSKTITITTP
jgi:hypothetical protein